MRENPTDKSRIRRELLRRGWRSGDVEPLLQDVNDCKLISALDLISELRAHALQRGIPGLLVRVALKFALAIDTAVIRETGHNVTLVDHTTDLILQPLLENLQK